MSLPNIPKPKLRLDLASVLLGAVWVILIIGIIAAACVALVRMGVLKIVRAVKSITGRF